MSLPVPLQPPALQPPLLRLPPGLALAVAEAAANHRTLHAVLGPCQPAWPQRGRGPEERVQLLRWVHLPGVLPTAITCLLLLSPPIFFVPSTSCLRPSPPVLILILPTHHLPHPAPLPAPPIISCSHPSPLSLQVSPLASTPAHHPLFLSPTLCLLHPSSPSVPLSILPPTLYSFCFYLMPLTPRLAPHSTSSLPLLLHVFPPPVASPLLP